jgi:hypothetical protein
LRAIRPYSLVSGPAYLHTLRGFTREERLSVKLLLRRIQLDPSVDGVHKILLAPDAPLTTYVGQDFYVFYFIEQNTIIVVDVERV